MHCPSGRAHASPAASMLILDHNVLRNDQRIIWCSLEPFIRCDDHILIANDILNQRIIPHIAFLHNDAVLDFYPFANHYATEQNTVLNFAANDAAIGYQ